MRSTRAVRVRGLEGLQAHALHTSRDLEQKVPCRYVLWLLGDVDAVIDSAAPLAEQLCQVSHKGADVVAIHWTQRADGLLCTDTGGHVTMYEALTSGLDMPNPHDPHITLESLIHILLSELLLSPIIGASLMRGSTAGGGKDMRLTALEALWQEQSTEPQTLLSAGRSIIMPSASAASGRKTVGDGA